MEGTMKKVGDVIRLEDYKYPWHEVLSVDGPSSTLHVYVDDRTGDVEIVQMNDDGESIRTVLCSVDVDGLITALVRARNIVGEKKGAPR